MGLSGDTLIMSAPRKRQYDRNAKRFSCDWRNRIRTILKDNKKERRHDEATE